MLSGVVAYSLLQVHSSPSASFPYFSGKEGTYQGLLIFSTLSTILKISSEKKIIKPIIIIIIKPFNVKHSVGPQRREGVKTAKLHGTDQQVS